MPTVSIILPPPLSEFDRAVLSVCAVYFDAGFTHITVAMIFRSLTGKKDSDAQPYSDQYYAILHSITKLMGTLISIDDSETNELLGYEQGKSITCSAILPAQFIETNVNGQKTATKKYSLEILSTPSRCRFHFFFCFP